MRRRSDRELLGEALENRLEIPHTRPSPLLRDYRPRLPQEMSGHRARLRMGPGDEGNLGPGWHRRETAPDGARFRWTEERAILYLRPRRGARRLRITVYYGHPEEESAIAVEVNGDLLGDLRFSRYPASREIAFPRPLRGTLEITILARNPFRVPREGGEAVKGVAVSRVEVR